eukprot:1203659-Pyramimonas_sp.AAC.1
MQWCKHCNTARKEVMASENAKPPGVWAEHHAHLLPVDVRPVGLQLRQSGWLGASLPATKYTTDQLPSLRALQQSMSELGDVAGAARYQQAVEELEKSQAPATPT